MHTLILGFDSFDPKLFERFSSEGKLPALTKYAGAGKYARLEVSDPPQTEVSWTSIATGLNPGGHGVFDFVHRDPATYMPFVSLLPTQQSLGGIQFVPPTRARTLFEEAARLGYPATSLWWPATFPARPESPVRTIPGLGTPDILGRIGVGVLYTTDTARANMEGKTPVRLLERAGKDSYRSALMGPVTKSRAASLDLQLEVLDPQHARLALGGKTIDLALGKWSEILEITFKVGLLFNVQAVTRVILTQTSPDVQLYFLPLQIHPLSSSFRYATPPGFIKDVWKSAGPYLTLGWPQDTTGLDEGILTDEQFLDLCDSIFAHREAVVMHLLDSFHEGVMAAIFDSLDRVQHMFRVRRPDVVESWYVRLDGLVGRVAGRLETPGKNKVKFMVLSDHGFADFKYKVHLNRWLADSGFLSTNDHHSAGGLEDVDWQNSQAYAVGLNSIYVNLAGREGQGSAPAEQYPQIVARLRDQLLQWKGPDGQPIARRVLLRDEVFSGPLKDYGPDLLVGYTPGYRASAETGLGKWKDDCIETNHDHWEADHCIDSLAVPGVFFSSHGLEGLAHPSYRDIPLLAVGRALEQSHVEPPPTPPSGGEDKDVVEQRLKDLGYL